MHKTPAESKAYWNSRAKEFRRYEGKKDKYAMDISNALQAHGVELKGSTLLDLGCGSGGFSIMFAKEGADVTSMDIAPAMLEMLAEDAKAENLNNIKLIESDWDAYKGSDRYDIIFCSLSPAVHDDFTRDKLLAYAKKWVVYLGFMPSTGHDPMEDLYKAHNISRRTFIGATDTHKWLQDKGIKYSTYTFKKGRTVKMNREKIIESFCEAISSSGAEPDISIVESFIPDFKTGDNEYTHTSIATVDMLIFSPE